MLCFLNYKQLREERREKREERREEKRREEKRREEKRRGEARRGEARRGEARRGWKDEESEGSCKPCQGWVLEGNGDQLNNFK